MQAIIMAAGKGSRLGDITKNLPKSFLEIEGKKLIEYNLNMLFKYGIEDIVIVTGYMAEKFETLFSDRKGIRFVFNPFYDNTNVLSSFWFGQELLKDDFIYMHADSLCDTEIFEHLLNQDGDIVLPTDYSQCNEEAMKVKLVGDEVKFINKTMDPKTADGEFIGIAKIKKKCLPIIKSITNKIMKEQNFSFFFEDY
jgi:choline kinase